MYIFSEHNSGLRFIILKNVCFNRFTIKFTVPTLEIYNISLKKIFILKSLNYILLYDIIYEYISVTSR